MKDVGSSDMLPPLSPVDAVAERRRRGAAMLAILSALLHGMSFLLPAYIGLIYKGKAKFEPGYMAFVVAAISPFSDSIRDPLIFAAFLANPLLWASGVCFWRKRYLASWVTSSLAVGLSVAMWCKVYQWELYKWLLMGYYVWVLSIVMFAAASAIAWINSRQPAAPHGFEVIGPKSRGQ